MRTPYRWEWRSILTGPSRVEMEAHLVACQYVDEAVQFDGTKKLADPHRCTTHRNLQLATAIQHRLRQGDIVSL
jgi:hypothetical protein